MSRYLLYLIASQQSQNQQDRRIFQLRTAPGRGGRGLVPWQVDEGKLRDNVDSLVPSGPRVRVANVLMPYVPCTPDSASN
jgi:hypothetical protein